MSEPSTEMTITLAAIEAARKKMIVRQQVCETLMPFALAGRPPDDGEIEDIAAALALASEHSGLQVPVASFRRELHDVVGRAAMLRDGGDNTTTG